jgi:hypothetical protein
MSTVGKKEVISHSVSPKRDMLVVPPGARGAESMHPAHVHEPEVKVNPTEPEYIDISKLIEQKKDEKILKKKQEKKSKKQQQQEQGALAGKAKNPSSSSSKSPKGRKPLTPRFEKIKARSVSPKGKGKGKEGKEGNEHSGGGTRKKQKRKLRKTHSRKRR